MHQSIDWSWWQEPADLRLSGLLACSPEGYAALSEFTTTYGWRRTGGARWRCSRPSFGQEVSALGVAVRNAGRKFRCASSDEAVVGAVAV